MSLVPDKIRKTKKVVDTSKLDAFVDEGLAGQRDRQPDAATAPELPPARGAQETGEATAAGSARRGGRKGADEGPKARRKSASGSETGEWKRSMHRAPSVAFSVRIPTPLLERMRDVVAAVDGESLTSLLVEGAAARVEDIETTYAEQVGQELPTRRQKVEL